MNGDHHKCWASGTDMRSTPYPFPTPEERQESLCYYDPVQEIGHSHNPETLELRPWFHPDDIRPQRWFKETKQWLETQLSEGKWKDTGSASDIYRQHDHTLELNIPAEISKKIPIPGHSESNADKIKTIILEIALYDILQDLGLTRYRDSDQPQPMNAVGMDGEYRLLMQHSYVTMAGTMLNIRNGIIDSLRSRTNWSPGNRHLLGIDDHQTDFMITVIPPEKSGLTEAVTMHHSTVPTMQNKAGPDLVMGSFLKAVGEHIPIGGALTIDYSLLVEDVLEGLIKQCGMDGLQSGVNYTAAYWPTINNQTAIGLDRQTLSGLQSGIRKHYPEAGTELS
jgi:hypothetical protein